MLCERVQQDIDEVNRIYKYMCNFEETLDKLQKKGLLTDSTIKGYTYFFNSLNRDLQDTLNDLNKKIQIKDVISFSTYKINKDK